MFACPMVSHVESSLRGNMVLNPFIVMMGCLIKGYVIVLKRGTFESGIAAGRSRLQNAHLELGENVLWPILKRHTQIDFSLKIIRQ